MPNRRSFLQTAIGLSAGILTTNELVAVPSQPTTATSNGISSSNIKGLISVPVISPDIGDLPYTLDGDVKVFHLVAHVISQRIAMDKVIDVWGFNGSAPGPTIQVNEGDRVRIVFDNHLPEPSSIHWHGFEDQIRFDGEPGISQDPVMPGGQFIYEFDIHQTGTYFYHSHMAMQEMAGMLGAFIMHPKEPYLPHCDRDFALCLQEYAVLPNNTVPNTMSMEYNWLLLNGKAGPSCTPLVVRLGDRVRIRFINLGMDHHPMHLHGYTFYTTGTEGGRIPEVAWWPGNTVLVGVAQARTIEFVANNPGDWMLHCHLPHHTMNQMSSTVGKMTRLSTEMPAGGDMNTGMGMLQGSPGTPLSEEYAATLGRGLGIAGSSDQLSTNGPLSDPKARAAMNIAPHSTDSVAGGMQMDAMKSEVTPNASDVPNFPQDAYMEGPMMSMDKMVERPENHGLRPGWSRFMQGMMTYVRVLPAPQYEDVIARMKQAHRPNDPYASQFQQG